MIIKDYFINLSIFSLLVSAAIFIQVFTINSSRYFEKLYGGIIAVTLMFFSFPYMGFSYDLRVVPLILSFIYFGRIAGWITLISIIVMRIFYTGGYWEPPVIAYLGMGILFSTFKTYFKKLHPFKSASLYFSVFIGIKWLVGVLFNTTLLYTGGLLYIALGLLIGLFLMEAYQRLYYLTQDLSKMNRELKKSKQELADTVHELQGGIFKFKKVDKHFIHTLCDGQFYYQNGFYSEQVVGKSLRTIDASIIPPHLVPQLMKYYLQAWEGKEIIFELPWPNDKTIILIALRPIKRNGQVIEVVGSTVDITERKKVESELSATKELLESFIKHNLDAITISDREGHILQANKAYEKIFGWSSQEIIGKRLPCVPDFLMEESLGNIQKILTGESVVTRLETVRQRSDGSLLDISLTVSPILDVRGNVIALSAICRDISERKQAERERHQLHQQLRDSEMKYRALIEQATDAVYVVELNEDNTPSRFIEVNPVGCRRFGYSREELLSLSFSNIVPQDSQIIVRLLEKIKKGQTSFTLQDEYVFPTGKVITTEFSVRVFNLNGKKVFLSISRDITERLKTEELLRKSEKLAVVGQLATVMAHEINNPLTAMKGFMQLLKSTENENNQGYINIVSSEIERIESITTEFMAVAKPQVVKMQPNNISVLMDQVLMLLQPQAMMHNIKFRIDLNPGIPLISCEGNQLKQVFVNILKNAIESMPMGGEILIQINILDNNQVSIRFIDQGCGIPKERIPYLGEPFYSIKEEGIGLGLMICYKIIETHQGKIFIKSEMNKGTTVEVTLPICTLQN
ncbi:TPA: PAS domain S-box protein [Bacillus cereus]|uniref:PAS domain S-box protein n=1 Tax=Bacillus TaxID=1386 RepID=UPI000A301103|nr:PAS domain S-box protein [Bacillus cereus]MED2681543.1 PAS domain S-box protein [Bacillus thuringiensis]EKS7861423.1 PAS domain S-box protein [Bacillus cereus]MBL3742062.1 PAS domain S-box protein [Bacillus cereus]MBL3864347.1 PAS domain S-box protein [Bacillus cereus]MBR9668345.1 PAS domain-containing sensor histidine kinase [Bacillus cereus]